MDDKHISMVDESGGVSANLIEIEGARIDARAKQGLGEYGLFDRVGIHRTWFILHTMRYLKSIRLSARKINYSVSPFAGFWRMTGWNAMNAIPAPNSL